MSVGLWERIMSWFHHPTPCRRSLIPDELYADARRTKEAAADFIQSAEQAQHKTRNVTMVARATTSQLRQADAIRLLVVDMRDDRHDEEGPAADVQ